MENIAMGPGQRGSMLHDESELASGGQEAKGLMTGVTPFSPRRILGAARRGIYSVVVWTCKLRGILRNLKSRKRWKDPHSTGESAGSGGRSRSRSGKDCGECGSWCVVWRNRRVAGGGEAVGEAGEGLGGRQSAVMCPEEGQEGHVKPVQSTGRTVRTRLRGPGGRSIPLWRMSAAATRERVAAESWKGGDGSRFQPFSMRKEIIQQALPLNSQNAVYRGEIGIAPTGVWDDVRTQASISD
ncbi:hypothetical protein C8R46DRAFT_1077807 [Mycena filopes]|nr:hypothetical protein C8R46DRAFT_1077807 [Mycena filopes]